MKIADSIIQKDKSKCFICGNCHWLEEHHCYGGNNRKISEKYGLKVYLCHYCHNEPPNGVHFNKENRLKLQQYTQKIAMQHYGWSVDDFIRIIGKNYI